jgi:hypothetical protein
VALIEWFFTETIYGMVVLLLPIYGLAYALKKLVPKAPQPFAVAALGFVLLIATLPSYARFKFERETLAAIERSPNTKVVATTRWGAIAEPITWFHAPVGFFNTVTPDSPLMGGGYRRVILRYEEQPTITLEDPDCEEFTNWVSAPDSGGTMRYTTTYPRPMTPDERELFCNTKWPAFVPITR